LNIVFDLGGVVFNWQPDAIIESVFDDAEARELVRKRIFEHADWVELDRGTLTPEQAIARGARRTNLPLRDIERLLDAVPLFLTPIQETIDLIRDLSNMPNEMYVLSNMHRASIAYLEHEHKIWDMFNGVVISSRIQMVKPELQIYGHLLSEYGLDPGKTIFIDDTQENLSAASSLGIRTIRFVDAAGCRQALAEEL
jgi:putative hydrolase of the HAD superfamily